LKAPAVPLSSTQSEVLLFLASQRDSESYVAGATPLNRDSPRYSGDIDIFHSREERLASAAESDAQKLEAAGYSIRWIRRSPAIYTAEVAGPAGTTRLEWVVDSEFRFFPVVRDEVFGYVLHPVDLAANKVMAAAGRREVRDIVDLVTIHETILPLGALVWAAVEKSPGYTPEGLIAEIRRNSNYPAAEWRALVSAAPIAPAAVLSKLRTALDEAEAFVVRMPTDKLGLLFLDAGKVAQPDPDHLDRYELHAGQIRGHWPASGAITTAMLEQSSKRKS
jgi:hypothetical protein